MTDPRLGPGLDDGGLDLAIERALAARRLSLEGHVLILSPTLDGSAWMLRKALERIERGICMKSGRYRLSLIPPGKVSLRFCSLGQDTASLEGLRVLGHYAFVAQCYAERAAIWRERVDRFVDQKAVDRLLDDFAHGGKE